MHIFEFILLLLFLFGNVVSLGLVIMFDFGKMIRLFLEEVIIAQLAQLFLECY